MTIKTKPLIEINQHALRVLYRELGVVDTVRFLKQFTTGFGNYTQERDEIFAGKTLTEIIQEIKQQSET
ncbi:MAG: hypothetical protein D6802_07405 [Ardenticatenia bacterium]|nr:MAG: hypothetical protein D6802_07405 [Ardenticatenia bacterium]